MTRISILQHLRSSNPETGDGFRVCLVDRYAKLMPVVKLGQDFIRLALLRLSADAKISCRDKFHFG